MSFVDLNVQFSYRSDVDDIATDFLVPVLSESISYKRSVGYFFHVIAYKSVRWIV